MNRERYIQRVREALVSAITARRNLTPETEHATMITAANAVGLIIDEANPDGDPNLETAFLYWLVADLAGFAAWLIESEYCTADPDRMLAVLGSVVAGAAEEGPGATP